MRLRLLLDERSRNSTPRVAYGCAGLRPGLDSRGGCRNINLLAAFLSSLERRPRTGLHVAQKRLLPGVFRMMLKKIGCQEICAAGMPGARDKAHVRGHPAVGSFALNRASRVVAFPPPLFHATRCDFDVSAQGAFVGLLFLLEAVEMIRQKGFGHLDIDLSFGSLHKFVSPRVARVHR